MNTVKVKVSFRKGTCIVTGINLVTGDFNSTVIDFQLDDIKGTNVFKMIDPDEKLILTKEIIDNQIPLYREGEVVDKNGYIKYKKDNKIYWYDKEAAKLYNEDYTESNESVDSMEKVIAKQSLFNMEGAYLFEIAKYDGDSKLTSAYGTLNVRQEQIPIEDTIVKPYIPVFDELLADVTDALARMDAIKIETIRLSGVTTIKITNSDGSVTESQVFDGPQGPEGPRGETGPQGIQGPVGPQGPIGPQGIQGERGPIGPQGIQGPEGPAGTGVTILGSFDTEEELKAAHPTGEKGDAYLIQGVLYVWSETKGVWDPVGTIQGPKGEPGAIGPEGPQGIQGPQGNPGYVFTPSVSENGDLSWSNNGGLDNPETRNIRGPEGPRGREAYKAGVGIQITEDGTINNTQTSAEWGNIKGDITSQEDLKQALDAKAESATTLEGYGIQNAYNKDEADELLATKAAKEIIVFDEADTTDDTALIIEGEEINTMGTEITNEKSDSTHLAYSANYLKDKLVCVSPTEPENGEEVWIQASDNLLNPNNKVSTSGAYTFANDIYTSTDGNTIRLMATVKVGKNYTVSYKNKNGFERVLVQDYNYGGSWITYGGNYNENGAINFTANTDTVIISFTNSTDGSTIEDVQLEQGSTATEYEPFVERKIFVRNQNGNYEEFIKPQVKVSPTMPSTGEKVWIQKGKNLFDINGPYWAVYGGPTIVGNKISFPTSSGNIGGTRFTQKIKLDAPIVLSAIASGGSARFLLRPLDSNGELITGLSIEGYIYLDVYQGYYGDIPDGEYSQVFDFEDRVSYVQLGFIHTGGAFENVQIEYGTRTTDYTKYVNPKLYTKNEHDIYEEYNSDNEEVVYEGTLKGAEVVFVNLNKYKRVYITYRLFDGYGNTGGYSNVLAMDLTKKGTQDERYTASAVCQYLSGGDFSTIQEKYMSIFAVYDPNNYTFFAAFVFDGGFVNNNTSYCVQKIVGVK